MPLPGESIATIHELLSEACELLERTPDNEEDREEIGNIIIKAQELLEAEDMEILRFGDITRIADHTYEPCNTIRKVIEVLKDFEVPEFEVTDNGESVLDENGDPVIDCAEAIQTIEEANELLGEYIESDSFPPPLINIPFV